MICVNSAQFTLAVWKTQFYQSFGQRNRLFVNVYNCSYADGFVDSYKEIVASSGNQEVMQETSKTIIKLSSRVTIVFFTFSITSVAILVIHNMLRNIVAGTRRQIIEFVQILAYLIAHVKSFASIILFFMYNSKVKSFFRPIFRSFFPDVDTNNQRKNRFSLSVKPRTYDNTKSN